MANVSLIITTHNRPQLLKRAVASAHMAGSEVDVIVVDDASTDATAAVCRELPDIHYVRLECNRGVAGARNAGLAVCTSEFVGFLDDDDIRLAGSLDRQIALLRSYPSAGLVYGQALIDRYDASSLKETGETNAIAAKLPRYPRRCLQGDIFWDLLQQNLLPCCSTVFRRSLLERCGAMDEDAPGLDDWDLWLRLSATNPVCVLATPVAIWRQSTPGSGQGSSQASDMVRRSLRQFRAKWLLLPRVQAATPARKARAKRYFYRNMTKHLLWETLRSMRRKRWREAYHNMQTVLELFPLTTLQMMLHPNTALFLARRIFYSRTINS